MSEKLKRGEPPNPVFIFDPSNFGVPYESDDNRVKLGWNPAGQLTPCKRWYETVLLEPSPHLALRGGPGWLDVADWSSPRKELPPISLISRPTQQNTAQRQQFIDVDWNNNAHLYLNQRPFYALNHGDFLIISPNYSYDAFSTEERPPEQMKAFTSVWHPYAILAENQRNTFAFYQIADPLCLPLESGNQLPDADAVALVLNQLYPNEDINNRLRIKAMFKGLGKICGLTDAVSVYAELHNRIKLAELGRSWYARQRDFETLHKLYEERGNVILSTYMTECLPYTPQLWEQATQPNDNPAFTLLNQVSDNLLERNAFPDDAELEFAFLQGLQPYYHWIISELNRYHQKTTQSKKMSMRKKTVYEPWELPRNPQLVREE